MHNKRNRDRGRLWLALIVVGVAALTALWFLGWSLSRETAPQAVRYGDLIQALRASRDNRGLSAQKMQLTYADIRGEFVTTDRVSLDEQTRQHTQKVPFRTARVGFERDQ